MKVLTKYWWVFLLVLLLLLVSWKSPETAQKKSPEGYDEAADAAKEFKAMLVEHCEMVKAYKMENEDPAAVQPYRNLSGDTEWGQFGSGIEDAGFDYGKEHRKILTWFKMVDLIPLGWNVVQFEFFIEEFLSNPFSDMPSIAIKNIHQCKP